MKCPVCREVNLVMADRKGVEIDYCPDCRGVWLDRGELDKIIERSAAYDAPAPQSVPPVEPVRQEPVARNDSRSSYSSSKHDKKYNKDGGKKNRMTDLLGDIFDF